MKRNIHKKIYDLLRSKGLLAISAGMILASCSTQMGGYSETDGVYYDPNKDTLPEGVVINQGNRVGEYYDFNDNSVIANNQENVNQYNNRYNDWDTTSSSDWGSYTGTETNIYNYNNWGWGNPWGWYGYSPYWRTGFSIGMSWGWGGPWGGWYGGYSPYWGAYNPWGWYGGYSPYSWYGGYYTPYYGGYYSPYYYNRLPYNRSGADGRLYNTNTAGFNRQNRNTSAFQNNVNRASAFRNNNTLNSGNRSFNNQNGTRPSYNYNGNVRPNTTNPNNSGFRNNTNRPNTDNGYQTPTRNNGGFRSGSSDGGFRSGGSNGGFRSSGGGFGGGATRSSGGGGMRSGGFR